MKFPVFSSRTGLTLVELLIFAAIFSVASVIFLGILISVTRVQVRQSAAAEVQQQSQFVLQTVQRYVEESSLVEVDANPSTKLRLRMPQNSRDPVEVWLDNGRILIKEGASASSSLTSDDVRVTLVSFKNTTSTSGHDVVSMMVVMELNSQNPLQRFAQTLKTSVARVGAATFDTSVLPGSGSLNLGVTGNTWKSVNDIIYFYNGNVGIGTNSPLKLLDVAGAMKGTSLEGNTVRVVPGGSSFGTCDSSLRGTIKVKNSGNVDTMAACLQTGASAWAWINLH